MAPGLAGLLTRGVGLSNLASVAGGVAMQQAGRITFTTGTLVDAAVLGVAVGVGVPLAARGLGRWRAASTLAVLAAVGLAMMLMASAPAARGDGHDAAGVPQGCQVLVDGKAVRDGDVVEVPADGRLAYAVAAPFPIRSWRVELLYGPMSFVVDEGTGTAGRAATGNLSVADYTQHGSGRYEVRATVFGAPHETCDGTVVVDVGGSVFATPIGLAALAGVGTGTAGLAWTSVQAFRAGVGPPPGAPPARPAAPGAPAGAKAAPAGKPPAGKAAPPPARPPPRLGR